MIQDPIVTPGADRRPEGADKEIAGAIRGRFGSDTPHALEWRAE